MEKLLEPVTAKKPRNKISEIKQPFQSEVEKPRACLSQVRLNLSGLKDCMWSISSKWHSRSGLFPLLPPIPQFHPLAATIILLRTGMTASLFVSSLKNPKLLCAPLTHLDQTKRKWFKLCLGRFRLDIRENSFMERVVKHCTDCPGKWASLEMLNNLVDVVLKTV